jgi:hypothetical protein
MIHSFILFIVLIKNTKNILKNQTKKYQLPQLELSMTKNNKKVLPTCAHKKIEQRQKMSIACFF